MVKNARIPFITEMIALMIIPFEEVLSLPFGSVLRIINLLTILLSVAAKKFRLTLFSKQNYRYITFVSFFCYVTISGIWSVYHQMYFDRLFTYLLYIVLILALNGLRPTAAEIKLMLRGLQLGGIIAAAFITFGRGMLDFEGRYTLSILGRYIDPNILSYSLVISFIINLYFLILDPESIRRHSVGWIIQFILAVGIIRLGSRGSFICVVLVSIYMVYIKPFKVNKYLKRMVFAIGSVITFLCFYYFFVMNTEVAERFTFDNLIGKGALGTANRYKIWAAAFTQIAKHPFFGYGNGASPYAIEEIYMFYGTHNSYILVLLEFGIVGLILYISWIVCEFRHCKGKEMLLFRLLILSMLLVTIFIEGLSTKVFWGVQIIIMLARPIKEDEEKDETIQSNATGTRRIRLRWGMC